MLGLLNGLEFFYLFSLISFYLSGLLSGRLKENLYLPSTDYSISVLVFLILNSYGFVLLIVFISL